MTAFRLTSGKVTFFGSEVFRFEGQDVGRVVVLAIRPHMFKVGRHETWTKASARNGAES